MIDTNTYGVMVAGLWLGQPPGTTEDSGFTASSGRVTANIDIETNVPIGCPVGTTRDAGFSSSTGHPTANVDIELNVPSGRPVGTTTDAGFNASTGDPTANVVCYVTCPDCNIQVHIRKKICVCGYRLIKNVVQQ